MTRSEAVSLIMLRLGKRTGLETEIVLELKQAQKDLEQAPALPWFLIKESVGLTTSAGSRVVVLPSDFLRESTTTKAWITTSDGVQLLHKEDYDALRGIAAEDESYLEAWYYALVGKNLYIFPEPDSAMAIEMFYFAADDELIADATENDWLTYASSVLVSLTGYRVARTLRDQEAMQMFQQDYQQGLAELTGSTIARGEAAMNSIMGG